MYFLIMIPFLLTGCKFGKGNNNNIPEEFQKTHTVESSKKGNKISNNQASKIANDIANAMNTKYSDDEGKFIEDATKFSYTFRNVIDDTYTLSSKVNYDGEAEFFSQNIVSYGDGQWSEMTNYEYAIDDTVYQVYESGGRGNYYTYPKKDYTYNGIFAFLSEMILQCGNQIKEMLTQMTTYGNMDMPSGSDVTIEYYSKGAGHLYMYMYIASAGITLEALCEDYWLTYEYMYTDLTKLKQYMPEGYELEYERMVTELYIDFNHATVKYPDISRYNHN